uniref:Immunoglobulin V-set domain-containing protein n=1 Tax=Xiphophorus couchianus TaxID=32473 RepID=A0A3B5LMP4_9TELE
HEFGFSQLWLLNFDLCTSFAVESSKVTLSYTYSKTATGTDYFFWYRQYLGKPPEFLISHSGTGTQTSQPLPGFSFNMNADKTQMDLLISSAAVTDSAVYYCAVRPTVTGNTRTLYKNLQYSTAATRGTRFGPVMSRPRLCEQTAGGGASVGLLLHHFQVGGARGHTLVLVNQDRFSRTAAGTGP